MFAVTRRVEDKANVTVCKLSVNVYRNKGCVFGGSLHLQIMELQKRSLRFDVVAKAARECKGAPCVAACVGLAI